MFPSFLRPSLVRAVPALPLLIALARCQASDGDAEPSTSGAAATPSPNSAAPAPAAPAASPSGSDGVASRNSARAAIAPASAAAPDAGASASAPPPAEPASTFASCVGVAATYDDCQVIHVSVVEASPARCIQLAIDNCGDYGRTGLNADVPRLWRLASATVRSRAEPCELGVYYPDSATIGDASGEITWDESTRQPSQVEIDVTLEESTVTGTPPTYQVTTSEPLNPQRCED